MPESLSQRTNTHKQKNTFLIFVHFIFTVMKFIKPLSELHNVSSIDIYSWHIQSLFSVVTAFRPGRGIIFSPDWFLPQTSLPIIKRLQYISDYLVWQRESNFVNVRKTEWLLSKQRQSWDDNPLSIVGSALTVFDDDKLIHKSNLVFSNVFNGQSNRSIFICSSSFSVSHFHHRWILLIRRYDNDFLWLEKKSCRALKCGPCAFHHDVKIDW